MELAESTIARTISDGLAQAGHAGKDRLHGAVLRKQGVFVSADPVDFAVKIVAVQTLGGRLEIVINIAGSGWGRKQRQNLRRDGVDGYGRLVSKRSAPGAVRVSCMRVIDDRAGTSKVSGD